MAPSDAHLRHSLSESWASVDGGAESIELTSDEEQIHAIRRRVAKANEAVNEKHPTMSTSSARTRSSPTPQPTPRKRTKANAKDEAQSPLIMPKLEHTSSHDSSMSPQKTALSRRGQGRASQLRSSPKPARSRTAKTKIDSGSPLEMLLRNILLPALKYLVSVLSIAVNFAKPVLGYALAIYLLVGAGMILTNLVFTRINSALAPLCYVPIVSSMLPFCDATAKQQAHGEPEFATLIATQSAFEDILTESAASAALPMDMKRSEASIRDLRHVVEYSALPSRGELVWEFTGFIDTARQASGDLTKYNSRIGHAVDRILSTNRWTLQVLDGIAATTSNQGALSRFASSINIFAPFQAASKTPHDLLFEQYIRHTSEIEEQIQSLIIEAQALLGVLQNLDDRLDLIAGIAYREDNRLRVDKDELLATLWTRFGGNSARVSRVKRQLDVLKEVGQYRRLAFAHVSGTMLKLQAIAAALEDLRERVARPEIVGIDGVEAGKGSGKGVPLEMHVGEILMGVERLEGVREEGRRIEGARLRSILDRDEKLALEAGTIGS